MLLLKPISMRKQGLSLAATFGKSLQATERRPEFSSPIRLSSTRENSLFCGYLRMSKAEWKAIATFH